MMEAYESLEKSWGERVGRPNTVVCATGTAALHLALESFCFPLGSEVIVPEYTMVACARAVTMAGLKPVFVDCGSDLLINPDLIEKKITPKTVAIMPVHIYGRRCAMDQIIEIADKLVVVEDCSEYHGGPIHPESEVCCWSFYKNKIVAGEEGGAISFRDDLTGRTEYAKCLRSHGFGLEQSHYHSPRGLSARMSNAHASVILANLSRFDENLKARRQIESWYDELIPTDLQMPARDVVWVYDLRLPTDADQGRIVWGLNEKAIAARHGFKPMSYQPEYQQILIDSSRLCAWKESLRIIYLPVYPTMPQTRVREIVDTLALL